MTAAPEWASRGDLLRWWRSEIAGLSQRQLAERLGVARTAVTNWEANSRMASIDAERIDVAMGADGVLAGWLWSFDTPEGLDPRRVWSYVYDGPSTPVWMWVRSTRPSVGIEAEWGMYRFEGRFEIGRSGMLVTVGVSIEGAPVVAQLSAPGWIDFGRGEVPDDLRGLPVVDALDHFTHSSASGDFTDLLSSNIAQRLGSLTPSEIANLSDEDRRALESFLDSLDEAAASHGSGWRAGPGHPCWRAPPPRGGPTTPGCGRPASCPWPTPRNCWPATPGPRRARTPSAGSKPGSAGPTTRCCPWPSTTSSAPTATWPTRRSPPAPARARWPSRPTGRHRSGSASSRQTTGPWHPPPPRRATAGLGPAPGVASGSAELRWGSWRRRVTGTVPLSVICHSSMVPLKITAEPGVSWTAGVGRPAGASPINHAWTPDSLATTQEALRTYQQALLDALRHSSEHPPPAAPGDRGDCRSHFDATGWTIGPPGTFHAYGGGP